MLRVCAAHVQSCRLQVLRYRLQVTYFIVNIVICRGEKLIGTLQFRGVRNVEFFLFRLTQIYA